MGAVGLTGGGVVFLCQLLKVIVYDPIHIPDCMVGNKPLCAWV